MSGKKRYDPEQYVWCKSHGICPNCGNAKSAPGTLLCESCREKKRAWRERNSGYQSERKHKLLAAGLCIGCGKQEHRPGYQMCETCAQKHRESKRRSLERRKREGATVEVSP